MIIGYEKSKEKSQRKKVFRIEKVVEMKIMDPILFIVIDDDLNLNDIILNVMQQMKYLISK